MIKPTRGFVLITPEQSDSQTESGLYLPESGQEKPMKGIVVGVGEDKIIAWEHVPMRDDAVPVEEPCPCNKGDKVIFKKWGGDEVKHEGVEYKLVKFEDIMAVID